MPPSPSPESNRGIDPVQLYYEQMGGHQLLTAEQEVELARDIEAGKEAVSRLELEGENLTRAERFRLLSSVERGNQAKDEFIRSNLRLVISVAKKYYKPSHSSSLDFLDLIQEGNLGLIRAVEKFDWRKGFKFSTYATWWIKQSVTRAVADKSRTIRHPVHVYDSIKTIANAEAALSAIDGVAPTEEEIAEEAGMPVAKVRAIKAIIRETVSIFAPVGEDGAELLDFIDESENLEDMAVAKFAGKELAPAFKRLSPKEQDMVLRRMGFYDGVPETLEEIAQDYRITRERARQILNKAFITMRQPAQETETNEPG